MRYIRYKYQKQLINFLNCCDNCNEWIETCQTRVTGFDSVCGLSSIVNSDNKYYLKIETNDQWRHIENRPDWFVGWANKNRIDYESFSNIGVPNSIARIRMYYKGYASFFTYGSDAESDKDYLIIGNIDEDLSIYDYESILSLNKSNLSTTKNQQREDFARQNTIDDGKMHFFDFIFIKNSDTNVGEDRAYLSFYLPNDFNGGNNLVTQPCDCGEVWAVEPLFNQRFTKLNPNYDWFCIDGNRHYKIMKQYSYDDGKSWIDTQEYEVGEVYEYDSPWCNGEECIDPKKKWEVYNTKQSGNTTITEFIKQYSFDNLIWNNLGYIDDKGDVTYEFKKLATNIEGCGRESAIEYEIAATTTYIAACGTYANPIVKARYKLGEYNYKNDSIIWGDWGIWSPLAVDIDYEIVDIPTIEKNETRNDKTYNYSVRGINKYSGLTASGKIIQLAGPCTPPVTPDPTPPPTPEEEEKDYSGDIVYTFIEKNIAVDGRNKPTSIEINGDWYGISNCEAYNGYDNEYLAEEYLRNCISTSTPLYSAQFPKHLVRLIKFPAQNNKLSELIQTFYECELAEELNLKDWDTSKVYNASRCFYGCKKLKKLDLNGWNTSELGRVPEMFCGCSSLTEIDFSSWDITELMTSAPFWYSKMFTGCSKLKKIYVKDNIVWWKERLSDSGVNGCEVIVK